MDGSIGKVKSRLIRYDDRPDVGINITDAIYRRRPEFNPLIRAEQRMSYFILAVAASAITLTLTVVLMVS